LTHATPLSNRVYSDRTNINPEKLLVPHINHYETVYGGNSGQNVAIGLVFVPKCTIVKTDRKTKQGNPLYGLDYPSQPPPIPYP
jgi:hypothetical protein